MPVLQIDGIKIATISARLATQLLDALDAPHVQVVRLDVGEMLSISKPVAAPMGKVMTASSTCVTVTLSIEASTLSIYSDLCTTQDGSRP
ncbi:hypothetical protein [Azorhizobium caulinodans]|uniref:hypothetical protein n=1 Tax=Azorhizobium caulinodans TaxID=7 RepID=UPI002FBD4002